jgi:hypothetical protein
MEVVPDAGNYNYGDPGKAREEAECGIIFPLQKNKDSGGSHKDQRKTYASQPGNIA